MISIYYLIQKTQNPDAAKFFYKKKNYHKFIKIKKCNKTKKYIHFTLRKQKLYDG